MRSEWIKRDIWIWICQLNSNNKMWCCILDKVMISHPNFVLGCICIEATAIRMLCIGAAIQTYGICQSMNSSSGRCHDNERCESMCTHEVGTAVWSLWHTEGDHRRIECSHLEMLHELLGQLLDLLNHWRASPSGETLIILLCSSCQLFLTISKCTSNI